MSKLLRDYDNGEPVDAVCMLTSLTVKETRQQKPFLRLEFGDSGGRVAGVMWEGFSEEVSRLQSGEILRVQGRMEQYEDRPQIVVRTLSRPAPGSFDPAGLLPSTERNVDEMLAELDRIVQSIRHEPIRKLLAAMFGDPDFRRKFALSPAAKRWHQPYLGGLLEHTLNVYAHAASAAGQYPEAEPDLVAAGVLLHDIGKTVEYNPENFFEVSTRGHLLGHLVIGVEILDEWLARVKDFPEEVGWHLKHMILSHHGQLEYGSPVTPQTLEALIVHFADDLDAKMSGVLRIYQRELEEPGDWTSYVKLLDRKFFKSRVLGEPGPAPAKEPRKKAEKPQPENPQNEEQARLSF